MQPNRPINNLGSRVGSTVIVTSAWSISSDSCIWYSNQSSSIASSSEASRHSGAKGNTACVDSSGGSKTAQLPSRTSQFNSLWVKSRTSQAIRTCNFHLSLTMMAHPSVILRFPVCHLLRSKGQVPIDGARLGFQGTRTRMCRLHQNPKQPALGKESVRALGAMQWETFLDVRTTDEQTCLAHDHKRSTTGRFGGSAQSSDLDI